MYAEILRAAPYASLPRAEFDDVLRFVQDGGYALSSYERYRKLFRDSEGQVHIRGERTARQARMNVGTIVEAPLLKVRMKSQNLGEVEEYFAEHAAPRRHFHVRRPPAAIPARTRDHAGVPRRRHRHADGAGLWLARACR